ncbi:MAG: hypothetical protein GX640_13920 [Fibrobacter sp.]|nr:hypothetical protein [Fibrobacter sp.]
MKVLWGLVPVSYDENNMVCFVKRYKTGPIRLIRRGDFHLRLGLGIKGSKASVNQICYPQMVKVPVYLHAPIRFGTFLKEVYIEMTPVLNYAENFRFIIPGTDFDKKLPDLSPSDSLILKQPNKEFMEVSDGERGYGWLLLANIPDSLLNSSCFISRKPSLRGGFADCGFKLVVNDLPKGYYDITNWVLFQTSTEDMLKEDHRAILRPLRIQTVDGRFFNSISNKLQK